MEYSLDIKLQSCRQIAQEKLQSILCSIPDNRKDLVIQPDLIGPLEHVCGATWLRLKGINKIYKFDKSNVPTRNLTLVYLIGCDHQRFADVLQQIQSIDKRQPTSSSDIADLKHFHIILFPTLLHSLQRHVEAEGMFGLVELHRFSWDFLVLDQNLVSLEIPQLFRDVFIRHDTSLLSAIASSLRIFNMVFKKPSIILSFGEHSERILEMIDRMQGFEKPTALSSPTADFGTMIVMDRSKDYPSCLLTPVVYSGLLLEVFASRCGVLHVDPPPNNRMRSNKVNFLQVAATDEQNTLKSEATTVRLRGADDSIYQENRYKHISDVVSLLSSQAKALGVEGRNIKDMKLNDMQDYVSKKLPKITSQKKELLKHLSLCEAIVNEVGAQFEKLHDMEESIMRNRNRKQSYARIQENLCVDAHKYNALRHISLLHLTGGGLSQDEAREFVSSYLNAFGFPMLPVFPTLADAKLFPPIDQLTKPKLLTQLSIPKWQQSQFQTEASKLKLLPQQQSSECDQPSSSSSTSSSGGGASGSGGAAGSSRSDPICPSYVFNGTYIPMVAQLTRILIDSRKFEEFLTKVAPLDQLKMHRYKDRTRESMRAIAADVKSGQAPDLFPIKSKNILVFIVGGVTYAEVAACNLVGRLCGAKIVLASNCVISGGDIMEAAVV